jgi:subtilisin family serine protease
VYAGVIHADAINMSFGAFVDMSDPEQKALAKAVQKAITFADIEGVIVVASSGNSGINLDRVGNFQRIPGQLQHVIDVGATGPLNQQNFDRLASYSDFGISGNDVVAPGGEFIDGVTLPQFILPDLIVSACSEFVSGCEGPDFYLWADGTSVSAPQVAATAAVVESTLKGDKAPDRIQACIENGAVNVGPGSSSALDAWTCFRRLPAAPSCKRAGGGRG